MFRKINLVSATFALITTLLMCAFANVQPQSKPKPTTAPINPNAAYNPTSTLVLNRTGTSTVQGQEIVTPVEIRFDNTTDYDNFAAGRLPINFILRNTVSGQTISLASKLLTEGSRRSEDKSRITIYVVINKVLAPVWDDQGCIDTQPAAQNIANNGVNITLSYAPCRSSQTSAQRPNVIDQYPFDGGPAGNIVIQGGKNGGLRIATGRSQVGEGLEQALKLKMNPSSNDPKRLVLILSSSKGSNSGRQPTF